MKYLVPVAFCKQFTRNLFNKRSLKFIFLRFSHFHLGRRWRSMFSIQWKTILPKDVETVLAKNKKCFFFSNQKPKEMKFIRFCWFAFPSDYIYTSLYLLQFLLSLFQCTDCCLNTVKFRLVQKYLSFHKCISHCQNIPPYVSISLLNNARIDYLMIWHDSNEIENENEIKFNATFVIYVAEMLIHLIVIMSRCCSCTPVACGSEYLSVIICV